VIVDKMLLFMEAHQPVRLSRRLVEELPLKEDGLFDHALNREILNRVADKCYNRVVETLWKAAKRYEKEWGDLKVVVGISGVLLRALETWRRDTFRLLEEAARSGLIEIVAQTYYHSLASIFSLEEFRLQVSSYMDLVREVAGRQPIAAENTEYIYNDLFAEALVSLGAKVLFTEGVTRVLGGKAPTEIYRVARGDARLLLRHYRLSDDIGFRFSARWWSEWPLTASKYARWVTDTPGEILVIGLDMETFGEHHWPETGIFDFLEWLPVELIRKGPVELVAASDLVNAEASHTLSVGLYDTISWADEERDLSAWLGNSMQQISFWRLASLRGMAAESGDELLDTWRFLGISDHFYYMSTKRGSAGEVHMYFNPYDTPHEAFLVYNLALNRLERKLACKASNSSLRRCLLSRKRLYDKAFHFTPTSFKALNLEELMLSVFKVPPPYLERHVKQGNISRWITESFREDNLASQIEELKGLPEDMIRERLFLVLQAFLHGEN